MKKNKKHWRHHQKPGAKVSSGQQDKLVDRVARLEKQLAQVSRIVEPLVKERQAQLDSFDTILISCDASITKNPGGDASYGAILRFPGEDKPLSFSGRGPAKTNNEAELDAIYQGLNSFTGMYLHKSKDIKKLEVRSDSQLSINLITGRKKTSAEILKRKAALIAELAKQTVALTGMDISFKWKRRNSTKDLEQANYICQDVLSVKRH